MPRTFELRFTKVSGDLYSGSLIVEGNQMAFGVPKTKEEIYRFLFGYDAPTKPVEAPSVPAKAPAGLTDTEWRFISSPSEVRRSEVEKS
jgi:hypothetical protein